MYQEISWIITVVLVAALGAGFLIIAKGANSASVDYAPIQKSASGLRSGLFILLLLVIVPIIGYTLTKMPYLDPPVEASKTVNVTGHQWYWEIDDPTARVGETILYQVGSADVNHGFAIYDPDLNVMAQTQAMPGYINSLLVTYPKPGSYKVLCLEFCGLAHHAMFAEISVSE